MTEPTPILLGKKSLRREAFENLAARYTAARAKIAEEGICIKHFRPVVVGLFEEIHSHNGGLAVAYRQRPGDSFVEVATALCSQKDGYSRRIGTVLAIEQFMNERRIRVPLLGATPAVVVEMLFRDLVTAYAMEV